MALCGQGSHLQREVLLYVYLYLLLSKSVLLHNL